MISQTFYPDIVTIMQREQEELKKRGYADTAKGIDHFLKGDSGTGFVYVAEDGKNYIITNYHVISQSRTDGLSVMFEKTGGEQTVYSNLSIIAADEEMDIALLAFSGGQNPFPESLAFLERPVEEGDDVYSAGFPGLGTAMIWQLGRGMVSNASVRLPDRDDETRLTGPYIQHTAQVDPGNSGGPLLIQVPGVPTGFAVAGINTLSARFRQGANYSIPMNRVRSFLDASLITKTEPGSAGLEKRIGLFLEGFDSSNAVYYHISKFLANSCTSENAEYALYEVTEKAPGPVQNEIFGSNSSPVAIMSHAVAWTIENSLRTKPGKISITKDSITEIDENNYTVNFLVGNKTVSSQWVNEYGIWRIKSFGSIAAGDKSLARKKAERREANAKLKAFPVLQLSAGLATIIERGAGFGADLIIRSGYVGYGFEVCVANNFFETGAFNGLYIPITADKCAFTLFLNIGAGFMVGTNGKGNDDDNMMRLNLNIFPQTGFQFTTAAVPGLYFQFAYQYNFIIDLLKKRENNNMPPDKNKLTFSIGYAF